ncbi:hypothetical protein [Paracoccus sp. Ld10]|uniref:hypothetical protein n=1 Tax=Paracoccus sp. Ld10 TaxID=649158 RepID=UPI003869879E
MAYAQTLTPRPGLGFAEAGALFVLVLGTIALAINQAGASSIVTNAKDLWPQKTSDWRMAQR